MLAFDLGLETVSPQASCLWHALEFSLEDYRCHFSLSLASWQEGGTHFFPILWFFHFLVNGQKVQTRCRCWKWDFDEDFGGFSLGLTELRGNDIL